MFVVLQFLLIASRSLQTGHSKPRTMAEIDVGSHGVGLTKRTKANTSKPRAKKTAGGRVAKTSSTKKESTVGKKVKKAVAKVEEKVNGAALKGEGAVERKPGKKVRICF